tara:strand:+ start:650 stop:1456 length:807 start_codon:yes stop_codon:yes gene_type:complete
MKYATKRLIDSVWTMGYEIKDDMAVIHSYDRENPIGYEQEKSLPQVSVKESAGRIVTSVVINENYDPFRMDHSKGGKEYVVANPKFVFSYDLDTPPEITVMPPEPTESAIYLSKVKVEGVSTSSTPYTAAVDDIKNGMRSALFDAIYASLKQKNILDAEQLTDLTLKAVKSVKLDVLSSEDKEVANGNDAYLQKIVIEVTQEPNAEHPVLTEDVLEATNSFSADHPKPWKSFSAVDARPAPPSNDIDEVENVQSVSMENERETPKFKR